MKSFFRLVIFLFFMFYLLGANAQYSVNHKKSVRLFEEAIKLFDQGKTSESLASLHKSVEMSPNFIEAWLLMADVYHFTGQTEGEVASYRKAVNISLSFFPNAIINLAEAELHLGQYQNASDHLHIGRTLVEKKNRIDSLIAWANFGINQKNAPVKFKPENMGKNLNSPLNEYWPSLTADEQILYYTVRLPSEGTTLTGDVAHQEDFYYSKWTTNGWMPSIAVGKPINTNLNEGAGNISVDGESFFFTSCNRPDGVGRCDLYVAIKDGKVWGSPVNMGVPVNSGFNDKQPSIAPDGKTLFFASNRGSSHGGMDIWYCKKSENGKWQEPVNIGEKINTRLDDESPYIHPDGVTLYFASKGHLGMGGFDLFLSRKMPDGTWSEPKNLGYPINTFNDETGLVVNARGTTAIYAAQKPEGFGGLDLYTFEIEQSIQPIWVTYVKGLVSDALNQQALEADVWVSRLSSDSLVNLCRSGKDGKYLLCLAAGYKYAMNAYKPGYLFYSSHFSLTNSDSAHRFYEYNILLQPIEVGKAIVLRNIFFKTNEYTLQENSGTELNQLLVFLNQNPLLKVELGGHTDNTGNREFNQNLSANRAKSVFDWLVFKGIAQERLKWAGYADTKPMADNDTEDGKAQNRRTEVVILSR